MDPFRVTCETCKSRLKVRSAEAIGEIHACPKCGSMVQIVPPADWNLEQVAAGAAISTTSAAEPAIALSSSISTDFPGDFAIELPAAPNDNVAQANVEITSSTSPVEVAAGVSPVVWCAIGGAVLFVVSGLTYILWPGGSEPSPMSANATIASPSRTAIEAQPEATAEHAEVVQPPISPNPYAVDRPRDSSGASIAALPIEPAAGPASGTAPNAAPKFDPPQTLPPAPSVTPATEQLAMAAVPTVATLPPPVERQAPAAADAPPTNVQAAPSETKHVLKIDPLNFDPEHISTSNGPANGATTPSAAASNSIAPEATRSESASENADDEQQIATVDILPPVEQQAIHVRRGPVVGDSSTVRDATARLAAQYPSLQLAEMPLSRFIETMSDISGVPITLDPLALEQNGMSPRTAISTAVTNETLDKCLRDALGLQRLDLLEDNGAVSVVLANRNERRAVDFDVKDLATDGDASQVAKLIERFVAPAEWKAGGGAGTIDVRGTTLHINQSLAVRREALIFCERLRLARGLSLRSKYPRDLLVVEPAFGRLAARLNQPTTFTYMAWTRLPEVVQEWQAALGLTILVDWTALRDADFGPESQLACAASDRPWTESLDGILTPLGLAWWAVDEQTIQVTTAEALRRIERSEFYTVPKKLREQFAASEQLIAALEMEITERPNNPDSSSGVQMAVVEPGARLVVRATPDVHRFLSTRLSAQ